MSRSPGRAAPAPCWLVRACWPSARMPLPVSPSTLCSTSPPADSSPCLYRPPLTRQYSASIHTISAAGHPCSGQLPPSRWSMPLLLLRPSAGRPPIAISMPSGQANTVSRHGARWRCERRRAAPSSGGYGARPGESEERGEEREAGQREKGIGERNATWGGRAAAAIGPRVHPKW
jgi:hypothetical protein